MEQLQQQHLAFAGHGYRQEDRPVRHVVESSWKTAHRTQWPHQMSNSYCRTRVAKRLTNDYLSVCTTGGTCDRQ